MTRSKDPIALIRDLALSRRVPGVPAIVSIVGGGGKTSALFALARAFARLRLRVLVTTTTKIMDPWTRSAREGRGFGELILNENPHGAREGWSIPPEDAPPEPSSGKVRGARGAAETRISDAEGHGEGALLEAALRGAGKSVVFAGARRGEKLVGVEPALVERIAPLFDAVVVEADGAKGLPIKAPADHEPAIVPGSVLVVAIIGLDALGKPLDDRIAHRCERLAAVSGCAIGSPLGAEHVARLAAAPDGAFKGTPAGALKLLVLNKNDLVSPELATTCSEAVANTGAVDLVLVASIAGSAAPR